jgi:hypothetical protein
MRRRNPDERLRALERRWHESGSDGDFDVYAAALRRTDPRLWLREEVLRAASYAAWRPAEVWGRGIYKGQGFTEAIPDPRAEFLRGRVTDALRALEVPQRRVHGIEQFDWIPGSGIYRVRSGRAVVVIRGPHAGRVDVIHGRGGTRKFCLGPPPLIGDRPPETRLLRQFVSSLTPIEVQAQTVGDPCVGVYDYQVVTLPQGVFHPDELPIFLPAPPEVKRVGSPRRRRNPDHELRRLERLARAGDPDAQEAFERHRERTFPAPEWIEMAKGDTFVTLRPLTGGVIVYGGPGRSYKIPEGTVVSDPYTARLGDIRFDWVDPDGKKQNTTVEGTKSRWPYDTGVFHTWSLKRITRGNPPHTDRLLRAAERLLIANPAMIDQFLRNIGVRPTEAERLAEEHGWEWGEHPDHPSEDWRYEAASGHERRGYWEWVADQVNLERNPPTSVQILRQAERILKSDPARLEQFLEDLLYTGRLPSPLIHRIHAELMRYDLMEKLPIYELAGPGGRQDLFGDRERALHEGAWRAFEVANNVTGRSALAAAIQALREDVDFVGALELFNEAFPATPIRVRQVLIE